MERLNENLEMRFDCLARIDEDDVDLRISLHEPAATRSTNSLQVDQVVTKITRLTEF